MPEEENLEQKLRELVELGDQTSDLALKDKVTKLAASLKQDIAKLRNKDREPCYFTGLEKVYSELYDFADTQDIDIYKTFKEVHLEKVSGTPFPQLDYRKEGFFGHSFLRDGELDMHLSLVEREVRQAAIDAAKKLGYDAVLVEEIDESVVFSDVLPLDMVTKKATVQYHARTIAKFYNKKVI